MVFSSKCLNFLFYNNYCNHSAEKIIFKKLDTSYMILIYNSKRKKKKVHMFQETQGIFHEGSISLIFWLPLKNTEQTPVSTGLGTRTTHNLLET